MLLWMRSVSKRLPRIQDAAASTFFEFLLEPAVDECDGTGQRRYGLDNQVECPVEFAGKIGGNRDTSGVLLVSSDPVAIFLREPRSGAWLPRLARCQAAVCHGTRVSLGSFSIFSFLAAWRSALFASEMARPWQETTRGSTSPAG